MFRSPGAIAFEIGPLAIRWYGILIASAMALGLALAYREAKRRGEDPEALLRAAELALIGSLVGARLYYVAFNWGYYSQFPGKIIAIWEGGLAIHGGIIGGLLVGGLYAWGKALPLVTYLDIVAPSLALGQAIGRWGNFFNQEAFGVPTDLPWRLFIEPGFRPPHLKQFDYFHPTFLYESLWNLLVFVALWFGLRRRLEDRPGALSLCYLGLYSVGRFFVEGLRIDSLMLGSLRAAQVVSLALVAAAGLGLLWMLRKR